MPTLSYIQGHPHVNTPRFDIICMMGWMLHTYLWCYAEYIEPMPIPDVFAYVAIIYYYVLRSGMVGY